MTTFTEADRRKILESLTSEELATFQEAFTVFDKNHDGTITTKVNIFILIGLNQQGTITTPVYLCYFDWIHLGGVSLKAPSLPPIKKVVRRIIKQI